MIDMDTFITIRYVMSDEFCQSQQSMPLARPGPSASLSASEVLTLALFGQWITFPSERAFYRYAQRNRKAAFPSLPDRAQFNRLLRSHRDVITAFGLHLVGLLDAQNCAYEVLDSTGVATRSAKRRGDGWLAGQADIGWWTRLGWYEGVHLLLSVTPTGVITGYGFGSASTNDKRLAQTLLGARCCADARLPSAGLPARAEYVADQGFAGRPGRGAYPQLAPVITAPHPSSKGPGWPKALRRWLCSIREIIETVNDKLLNTFRLARERPHEMTGLQARLASKVGLHNFCIWLNSQFDRPALAFADLIDWEISFHEFTPNVSAGGAPPRFLQNDPLAMHMDLVTKAVHGWTGVCSRELSGASPAQAGLRAVNWRL